jgi:SAM-dependent methyltransferase
MPIDFRDESNRYSYSGREVDPGWSQMITRLVDPHEKSVVDIGCGGGLYGRAWLALGAARVIGIDFSHPMARTARDIARRARRWARFECFVAEAGATGLPRASGDLVFERALIHHLANRQAALREAYRLVRPGGRYLIQDRTLDDLRFPASPQHIRGYFFECFPRLWSFEAARRPQREALMAQLEAAGFSQVTARSFWETRQIYPDFQDLADELRARKGRSILHELSDAEIEQFVDYLAGYLPRVGPIVERDRWTIWQGIRR